MSDELRDENPDETSPELKTSATFMNDYDPQPGTSKAAVKHLPHTFRIKKEPMELLEFTTVTGSPMADWNDLISESEDESDNVNGAMGRDGNKDGSD